MPTDKEKRRAKDGKRKLESIDRTSHIIKKASHTRWYLVSSGGGLISKVALEPSAAPKGCPSVSSNVVASCPMGLRSHCNRAGGTEELKSESYLIFIYLPLHLPRALCGLAKAIQKPSSPHILLFISLESSFDNGDHSYALLCLLERFRGEEFSFYSELLKASLWLRCFFWAKILS